MRDSEMLAQAGSNESQDSQAILEAYRAEFGVGTLSSSPQKFVSSSKASMKTLRQIPSPASEVIVPSSDPIVVENVVRRDSAPHDALSDRARSEGPTVENDEPSHWDTTGVALTQSKKQCATLKADELSGVARGPENRVKLIDSVNSKTRVPDTFIRPRHSSNFSARHDSAKPQTVQNDAPEPLIGSIKPPTIAAAAALRKMDFSQQTPTQVNDDRDYSEFCDIVPSSPVNGDTQSGSLEPRTLQDDDTGAVNFANLSELGRPSSQISEDAGFENTKGDWRHPDRTSQLNNGQTPHRPHAPAFETPAIPKNPFATKPNIAAPLAGSQLFGQTQFSSAIKHISPTSSRPSPNLFNSISPNIIETSPLKNRANVSSPTDIRTSSPQRLHEIPETSLRDDYDDTIRAQTPLGSRSKGGDLVAESPPSSDPTPRPQAPRSSSTTEPMTHYEPMKKSQERKTIEPVIISPVDSDDDSDDAIRQMERRRKIERKRAKAAEEMGRVSFTPKIRRDSAEKPLRKKKRPEDLQKPYGLPKIDTGLSKGQELPALVDDSQKGVAGSNETLPVASTKATPGNSAPENRATDHDGDIILVDAGKVAVDEDRIPATSPAPSPTPSLPPTAPVDFPPPSEPELPKLRVDDEELRGFDEHSEPSSLPPPRKRTNRTYGRAVRQKRRNPFLSSSNSDGLMGELEPRTTSMSSPLHKAVAVSMIEEESEQELPVPQGMPDKSEVKPTSKPRKTTRDIYADLPQPMTTRSRRSDPAGTTPVTPVANRSAAQNLPTSSSLSVLTTTPVPSDKTTPGTQDSPTSERPESVTLPSPGASRSSRKRKARSGTKSESPQQGTRSTRISKRFPRLDSESTDELHFSPAASVLERSMVHSKSSRSFKQSFAPIHRTGRLFEGMVFAISFQDKVKPQERKKMETKIIQSGGTILAEGFQDMFEHSSIMNTTSPVMDEEDALKLTKQSCEGGFTALIADAHSRKVKYMQALALGLPCLAQQWITACCNKGAIVDWEPYILCAGASAVLGNALRSRILAPYSAAEARLVDVIEQRPRLLDGQRVLVVVDSKKSRNDAKEPYIFLATVLGPSISRVFSTQQARELLLEQQKVGNPFDWLYLDKGTGTIDAILTSSEASGGKKRRKSAAATQPKIENIRVLDDELVIQSLILGRMVEADEMYT